MSSADDWAAMSAEPSAPAPAVMSPAAEWAAMKSPDAIPKGSPVALGTDTQNLAAGAGKAVTDIARAGKQLMDIPAKWLEDKFPGISEWSQKSLGMPSAAASAAATNQDVVESRARDAPLMATKAGLAGNIAGNAATIMLPLAGAAKLGSAGAAAMLNPTTYGAAAASGALQGALQPTVGDESHLMNAGVGTVAGLAGNALVNTVGRVAQPVQAIASAAHDKAVQVLQNAGIPLDAAQTSGSVFLNKLRSGFGDNPFTAGAQAQANSVQKAAYNNAVLKTIGENAPAATPDVMGAAADRINGVFKDVLDRNNVTLPDSILARIGDVQKAANEEGKTAVSQVANRIMNGIDDNGTVSGQIAYGIKKDLDRLGSSQDTTLAYHARQLRSTLMDAINGSLPDADRAAFSQARGQFANMKKIEGAIDATGAGDISPAKLANVFAQKKNRSISIYGNGPQDLNDLAKAGNMLLPDKTPQSGSVPRAAIQMLAPLAVGAGAGGGEYYNSRSGEAAGEAALGTIGALYAAPKIAQYAMSNPTVRNYMTQGMSGGMTPLRDLFLLPNTNTAIGGAVRRAIPAAYEQKRINPPS